MCTHHCISQEKRNAQLLGGTDVPAKILDSLLLSRAAIPKPVIGPQNALAFIHMSPLDGCFEQAALGWKQHFHGVRLWGASKSPEDVSGCNARLEKRFLEDWKSATNKYAPASSVRYCGDVDVTVQQDALPPTLALAIFSLDGKEVILPTAVRAKWADDPVYGPEWRAQLQNFDNNLGKSDDPVVEPEVAPNDQGHDQGGQHKQPG